ncbi:hypothetical protein SAMN06295912_12920 [Sphingomonas laterariae]|uniref:DUF1134 domain-containing protein n=1 Tax=Edaphosphingomonas laterariae TaxID=861865 RepID=A0A239J0T7_9SPHN|nr:DUF1134 domain-containing protein [Sphingomonas laterariae]SNS99477.1 hypothetical protein SAMN06295912_12920 [Sphingomonas laterariae]
MPKLLATCLLGLGTAALAAVPAAAQVRTVDPNTAIQADVAPVPASEAGYGTDVTAPAPAPAPTPAPAGEPAPATAATTSAEANGTYQENDVLSAAEGVFGRGAEGLAKMIESILKDQGEPNGYIVGREAGGALAIGVRYGSGTMFHKVEGQRPVYWTGPSVGFDIGANGSKTFVLVYNLYDSQELYQRYPAVEGQAYVIGGFTASYMRRGDVVLIPIRLGVGWRLGANVGYMNFTEKSKILPF